MIQMEKESTHIRIDKKVKNSLNKLKNSNESYSDLISFLMFPGKKNVNTGVNSMLTPVNIVGIGAFIGLLSLLFYAALYEGIYK